MRVIDIIRMKIPEDKLTIIKTEAELYAKLSVHEIKQKMKFRYKRITKILFAEYFIGA